MNVVVKKILKWSGALLLLSVVVSVALLQYSGAWSVFFPSSEHDSVAPVLPDTMRSPAILLFSKTNSFRHTEGIEAGTRLIKSLGEKNGWSVFHTENGAIFNTDDLARFSLVMFHNATGDMLSKEQQVVFQQWMEAGGGWVGIHAAGDGSHKEWPWYVENLLGAKFTAHPLGPQFQVAQVSNEQPTHPAMAQLPVSWEHEEEWYSWEHSPRDKGFTILASIDEGSYVPVQNLLLTKNDLRMGDHPVVWSRCLGRARVLYSALGHQSSAYQDETHQRLLENAISWAMDSAMCEDAR